VHLTERAERQGKRKKILIHHFSVWLSRINNNFIKDQGQIQIRLHFLRDHGILERDLYQHEGAAESMIEY